MFQFSGFASYSYVFTIRYPKKGGFPHSEILVYNGFYHLNQTYRRLTRPSSPPIAKASTVYAYSLNHTTLNALADSVVYYVSYLLVT